MKKTNLIYESEEIGLEAVTILDNRPYFFLFSDIDTKDEEELRIIIDFFHKRRLAFLWYETTKGYHVVSPVLMSLREWDLAKKELHELTSNYYNHLAIRISSRHSDNRTVCWENSTYPSEYKISSSLLRIFELRFDCKLLAPDSYKTKLFYVKYKQTRVIL